MSNYYCLWWEDSVGNFFLSEAFKIYLLHRHLSIAERTQVFLHLGTLISHICLSSIKKKKGEKKASLVNSEFSQEKRISPGDNKQSCSFLIAGRSRPWEMKWFAQCYGGTLMQNQELNSCSTQSAAYPQDHLYFLENDPFVLHIYCSMSNAERFLAVIHDLPRSANCLDIQTL